MKHPRLLVLPAAAVMFAPILTGCGDSGGAGSGGSVVIGTTDTVGSLDPAGAYDTGTWTLFTNTFQTLLRYPKTGTNPEAEVAKECHFSDELGQAYRCKLKTGLTFSNGHALTAEDVKFSVDRTMKIANANGPASLLSNIDKVETPDQHTVVFHLKAPDATFPFKVATPAMAIVDSQTYPATKLVKDEKVTGSGPYKLDSYTKGKKAVFTANEHYRGGASLENSKVEVEYFTDGAKMQEALESGDIDMISRTLTPNQVTTLEGESDKGLEIVEMPSAEIRYLVFDTNNPQVEDKAVRQAIAELVDRKALVRDVYERTAQPLYSMIPQGVTGHINSFFNMYGDPSKAKAADTLAQANITTPVPITLWYTTDHYGAATADEFAELKRQLEASGLFKVTLDSARWNNYGYAERKYPVYGMGWFPDFADPDTYIAPFLDKDNFLNLAYRNDTVISKLLPRTRQEDDRSATVSQFRQAQDIIAKDVPLLPLWQGRQYVAMHDNISGVQWAMDGASCYRYWVISKGVAG